MGSASDASVSPQSGDRATANMRAITISRQYGSGGGEVAARLARRLGWHLIDHEVVAQVARALGITPEEAEERDERVEGLVTRLVNSMALAYPTLSTDAPPTPLPRFQGFAYQEALRRVILAAVDQGQVVIVGRGAQSVLRDRRDVLRALVVAPIEARVRYVALRERLDESAARRRIEQRDRDRERYLQDAFHHRGLDPVLYDVSVNTETLSLDRVVDLICGALALKGERLRIPPDQLGPSAEVGTYPGQPADLPPPSEGDTPPA